MNSEPTKKDFLIIIGNYPDKVQKMAVALREAIFKVFPETVEVPWVDQKVVGYGVGLKKMSEHFCYMVFAKDHINFGFNHGVNLLDPHRLLGGTGKKFRNTKIYAINDVYNPNLAALIKQSINERKKVLKK